MEICFHRNIKSVIIIINFDALIFFVCFFNEHFILLEYEIAIYFLFSTESSAQVTQTGTQNKKKKKEKTAGASMADSSTLTLIKLQSISAKCQETLRSSAI